MNVPLTDFRMPGGLRGISLTQLATRLHPSIHQVLITTGMDPEFRQQILDAGFVALDKL
jgi:CheY-like chemotaxis protein